MEKKNELSLAIAFNIMPFLREQNIADERL